MPKVYAMADSSINDQLIKIRLVKNHSEARGNIFAGPLWE